MMLGLAGAEQAYPELVRRPIYVNSEGKTVYQYVFQSGRTRYARRACYSVYSPSYGGYGVRFFRRHHHHPPGKGKPPGYELRAGY